MVKIIQIVEFQIFILFKISHKHKLIEIKFQGFYYY